MSNRISYWTVLAASIITAYWNSAQSAAERNFLKNPSFESVDGRGMPVDWGLSKLALPGKQGEPTLIIGPPGHSGKMAAQLSFGPELEWAYVNQIYWKILSPGEKYVFSAWFKSDQPSRVSLALFALGMQPKPGEKILELQKREWIQTTGEWKRTSVGLTVPKTGGQFVRLWCVAQVHTPDVTVTIDDAQLVHKNPAPSGEVSLHRTHSVGCVRTAEAPVIDGKLDDASWLRAGVAENFTNLANAAKAKPTQQTKVYLLFDDENLYVGYRCYESDLDAIKAEKTERDAKRLWDDDCVEVFLIPPDSAFSGVPIVGAKYYYLLVNSLGTQSDNVGLFKVDQWNGKWQASTAREKDAWTIEIRIPFTDVDSRQRYGAPWKVNFTRSEKRLGENSSWAPLDLKFHDPARFADMYFVKEPGEAALVLAAAVKAQAGKITGKLRKALSTTDDEIERILSLLRATPNERALALSKRVATARKSIGTLLKKLDALKPQEVLDRREEIEERIETSVNNANVLANTADASARAPKGTSFVVLDAPTITNDRILPMSLITKRRVAGALTLSACPGEYEPASLLVTPSRDVEGVSVTCSDLASADGAIDASQIDIKLVKCWYQSFSEPWTGGVSYQRGKVLLPELLVNDDDLVRVDLEKKRNLLRVTDPKTGETRYEDVTGENEALTQTLQIHDADALEPVDIPAGQVRQFWVTVHVPDDAKAGTYEGIVSVTSEGSVVALPINLTVYPFVLARSIVEQAIFYRGKLQATDVPVIDKDKKTAVQYEAELRNMLAHGVDTPLVYQPPQGSARMDLMRRVLEMRKAAGVRTDRFFFCAWGIGPEDTDTDTRHVLGEMLKLARSFGYREFYNYGPDEPSAEQVRQHIEPWKFLREEIGVKVYLACNSFTDTTGALRKDLWSLVKNHVNAFVVGGAPNAKLAATMHEAGIRIYNYANPQCGIEEPETYRRNYGLLLWKAGYDGAMDYAYQHGFGSCDQMWNDFDSAGLTNPYRDHVMAYPTSDGVVDTLQWEGYREGVDDLRYLSTLLQTIPEAKKDPKRAGRAGEIERWIETIDPNGDLDVLRAQIVTFILELTTLAK